MGAATETRATTPPPGALRRRLRAAAMLVLAAYPLVAGTLGVVVGGPEGYWIAGAGIALVIGIPAVMGWLILRARPGNPIGWLLLGHATLLTTAMVPDAWTDWSLREHGGTLPFTALAAYITDATWPAWFAGLAAIAFVFPDGRLPSRRWRGPAWFAIASFVIFMSVALFSHETLDAPRSGLVNPLPELPGPVHVVGQAFVFGILASLFVAAAAVRTRLRRAAEAERLQLLWLTWASCAIPGALLVCWTEAAMNGGTIGPVTLAAVVVMAALVPIAIGIGVLRHRLFDIELAVSRTLLYGTLSVCGAGLYVGVVAGVGALVGNRGVAGLVGAGLVAATIQPLHARLQRRVERLVYGDRRQPYAALQRLSRRLQATVAPQEVLETIVEAIAEALRLPYVAVELPGTGGVGAIVTHGARGSGRLDRRELTYRGEPEGVLAVEVPADRPLAGGDRQLLDDLVRHAGVAVQSVRLLDDLRRSRTALVTAREEERRRLRRDLHDGVGPTLAAMSLRLDVVRDRVGPDEAAIVDQLAADIREAITDIRRLVHDLRPPVLDEYGLVAALVEHAARLSTPTSTIEVVAEDALPPLPAAIEVATFRIALEAMTNVRRHADASRCTVTVELGDALALRVEDDGRGIARDATPGVGLASMRERAAELGGSVTIEARPGGGTRIEALLPLGGP